MARSRFGGTPNDYVIDATGQPLRNITGSAWDSEHGGNQHIDLLDSAGNATTAVTTNGAGFFDFQGPDGVDEVWLDFGSDRKLALSYGGIESRIDALEATVGASGLTQRVLGVVWDGTGAVPARPTAGSAFVLWVTDTDPGAHALNGDLAVGGFA